MRKLFLVLLSLMFILSLFAETMYIHLSDGTTEEFDIIDINEITFGDVSADEMMQIISQLPIKFIKNFPNPFNPETTIQFELNESGKTEVEIFNVKGQKVKQLINDQLVSGQHSVIWDGNDASGKRVSSGVYFYQIKCDNYIKSKKMLMIK